MPLSSVSYTGNGSLTLYSVPFQYIERSHVKVYLNGVLTSAYTWNSVSTINFNTAPANGVVILIQRETPSDELLVDFSNTSTITETDLDKAFTQNLYVQQENTDRIAVAEDDIADIQVDIGVVEADIAALEAADVALDSRLDTTEADITAIEGSITALDTAYKAADAALDGRLDTAEATLVSHGSRLTTAESDIDALQSADVSLDGRLDTAEATLVTLDGRLDTAETDITALQSGKANTSHTHTASQITDFNDAVDARVGELSSGVTSFNGRTGIVSPQSGDYSSFYSSVTHSHSISDITGLQTALDGKAASSHSHAISDVTNLQTTLDGKASLTHSHVIADVTGLQAVLDAKAASSHTHAIADVTGLQTALDGKAASSHTHTIANITNLQTTLDGKASTSHTHTIADLPEATTAQFRNNTADRVLSTDQVWGAADLVSLTDGTTVAVDMSTGINFTVTLAGNRTLGAPTNTKVGQTGVIYVVQDANGSRTLNYNSVYKFAGGSAPTLSTAANAVDRLTYFVRSSTHIDIDISKDRK